MNENSKPYPLNKQEPDDATMGATYAGPETPDEERARKMMEQALKTPMFDDRAYNPDQQPLMMMVYAGPQQMSDGSFSSMFHQQMQPQKRQPEPGREVVGYCHDCGAPLYARSKFCPECGTQLKFLK